MANIKITDLTAYTDPLNTDVLPIVDVTSDTTKKVSIANLLKNASSGTAAAPGIAFDGDSNTGIYRPGADELAVATNGTGRLFIDSSGNAGIGTSNPGGNLHVQGAAGDACRFYMTDGDAPGVSNSLLLYKSGNKSRLSDRSASGFLTFGTADTERVRLDSTGRLLVGTSSALSVNSITAGVEVHASTTNNGASISVARFNNNSFGPQLNLGKSRNSTIAAGTIVQNGDDLGGLFFNGDDGTDLNTAAASIKAFVDGTPGADDMPGRLVFSVTADGASSPTEAMRIKSSRILNFANAPTYADNAAAKTGGLVDGDVYRKSDGTLMIVYT